MFTAGVTSAALACCEWGGPAPIAYQWGDWGGGCGGCAPVATYAEPCRRWWRRGWLGRWLRLQRCGGCNGLYATPALEPTPIALAPPDYTGPGPVVPYRVYGPDAGAAPRRRTPTWPATLIRYAIG